MSDTTPMKGDNSFVMPETPSNLNGTYDINEREQRWTAKRDTAQFVHYIFTTASEHAEKKLKVRLKELAEVEKKLNLHLEIAQLVRLRDYLRCGCIKVVEQDDSLVDEDSELRLERIAKEVAEQLKKEDLEFEPEVGIREEEPDFDAFVEKVAVALAKRIQLPSQESIPKAEVTQLIRAIRNESTQSIQGLAIFSLCCVAFGTIAIWVQQSGGLRHRSAVIG